MKGFHIIVVPGNAAKTKRIHVSTLTVRMLALLGVLIVPVFAGAVFSTIHYQNKLLALKNQMLEENQIVEQKELLSAKLQNIERALSKTQLSMEQLKGDLSMDVSAIQTGVGPLDPELAIDAKAAGLPKISESIDSFLEKGGKLNVATVNTKVHDYDEELETLQSEIESIYTLNEDKIKYLSAMPNVMPVDGWITSGFGIRHHPLAGNFKMHYGIDIASPTGTIVRAPSDGRVVLADYSGGYGNKVVMDHGFGVSTVFAHASELLVKKGDIVKKGDPLASVGSTGSSTGPHVHYEVHVDGIPTDPLQFVFK